MTSLATLRTAPALPDVVGMNNNNNNVYPYASSSSWSTVELVGA